MNITGTFDGLFTGLHGILQPIRDMLTKSFPELAIIIYMGLAGVAGYYLYKRYPLIQGYMVAVLYAILVFLVLRFV